GPTRRRGAGRAFRARGVGRLPAGHRGGQSSTFFQTAGRNGGSIGIYSIGAPCAGRAAPARGRSEHGTARGSPMDAFRRLFSRPRWPAAALTAWPLAAVLLVVLGFGGWLLYRQQADARARRLQADEEARAVLGRARGLLEEGWQAQDLAKLR